VTTQQNVLTAAQFEQLVERVVEVLAERQRVTVLKQREAILMTLRALEEANGLPHAIPTKQERGETKAPWRQGHNR
jgi:hypothetical protein